MLPWTSTSALLLPLESTFQHHNCHHNRHHIHHQNCHHRHHTHHHLGPDNLLIASHALQEIHFQEIQTKSLLFYVPERVRIKTMIIK